MELECNRWVSIFKKECSRANYVDMSLKYQVAFLAKGAFTIYVDRGREDFFQVSEKVNKFQQINYLQ